MKHWLAGHDDEVATWAGEQLGVRFTRPYRAIGVLDDLGTLIGAAVFNDYYRHGNVELTYVGPGSLSRRIIRALASFAFNDLQVSRITAKTKRRNGIACKLLPRAGFKFEFVQKRYFGPDRGDDAVVYALSCDDAERWLEGGR